MPGTKGKSDLFKVAVNEDGSFGPIAPIHKDINTEARETFPFVTSSNILFFASDGHPGMGGLDLFSLDLNNPNAKVISLGASINSAFDDFGLLVSDDLSQAFFTSNRAGGKGDDDIYSVAVREIPLTLEQKQDAIEKVVVSGTIKDNALNELLPNVNVVLVDATDKEIARTKTDEKGKYTFTNVLPNTNYFVNVNKFDKLVQKIPVTVAATSVSTEVAVSKNLVVPKVDITKAPTNVGVDVALALKIDQIYFDTNKYEIRPDAKLDLDLLVAYLKLNVDVKIEIGSHTDSRDTKEYNMILSQKRAQSTLNYIVSEGIDATRLIAVGYGESKLVNKCSDGVKCTEAQHQQNRRSSFVIK
jgi:outer membrane protein OmpA-like peptidoglycan-associated protein